MFFKDNTSLKELNVSYNGIGDNGVDSIAKTLPDLESLIRLDLTANRIGQMGIGKIMSSVGHTKSLIELKVVYDKVSEFNFKFDFQFLTKLA